MLLFFKLPKQEKVNNKISLKEEYKNYWGQFKGLLKVPGMGFFLLSYFFFNDAIITVSINFPIYLQNVFLFPIALNQCSLQAYLQLQPLVLSVLVL